MKPPEQWRLKAALLFVEGNMPKFVVENLQDSPLAIGIEPWADSELLPPRERVEFEYDEPAEISFSVRGNNGVCVGIVSDRIRITSNRGEKLFPP